MRVTIFSPAKINLYLAVTGRRADGFHDLVSVVAPLDFGDGLEAESREPGAGSPAFAKASAGGQFSLECDMPGMPVDDSNLVLKAAHAFVAATGWKQGVAFKLTKRIPLGAGLGGGSSNAVAALRALNKLSGGLLSESKLGEVALTLGSDCALFLHHRPVVMRGRGERIEALPESAGKRVRGQRVLLFKPGFGIGTPWAYQRMVVRGTYYLPTAEAEARLAEWTGGSAPAGELLFNNLERVAFEKFLALPALLGKLQAELGVAARMSGSGSACFALLEDRSKGMTQAGPAPSADNLTRMKHMIAQCWGPSAFVQEARLA